jgi:hypothetical protein
MSDSQQNVVVLSENSHVKITIARAIMAAAVLMSMAASGGVAWYAVNAKTDSHIANPYVHLDPKFTSEHGFPVGKWDLAGRDDAATASFKALQDQADYMKRRMDVLEAEVASHKPRWHP